MLAFLETKHTNITKSISIEKRSIRNDENGNIHADKRTTAENDCTQCICSEQK